MKALLAGFACVLVCGCNSLASFNDEIRETIAFQLAPPEEKPAPERPNPMRASLQVDGKRGNPKVLFFLALSGGGSRASYLSAATMLKLQKVFDVDLLGQVDVISSVSGGSLPAAYYAVSHDRKTASDVLRVRLWDDETVRDLMKRDYLMRWALNWFWPGNIAAYWLTSYDRSDIMAQTLEDNLYDTPVLGQALTFKDLNPTRPFLILNATNATEQSADNPADVFSFGSVFTFTQEDFADRLNSDIGVFPIARAVQASAAFPSVFANVTLRDFRRDGPDECKDGYAHRTDRLCDPRYVHVFDGGNSDNLGLRSIKRSLFELKVQNQLRNYEKVVVLLVDAFTQPRGVRRTDFDTRTLIGRLIDPNLSDAVDSLLQANRTNLVSEFRRGMLSWGSECGNAGVRNLPPKLCAQLGRGDSLDVTGQLVFYHLGFAAAPADLKPNLDAIPTSFSIGEREAQDIDSFVNFVLTDRNPCLLQLRELVAKSSTPIVPAQAACSGGGDARLGNDDEQAPATVVAPARQPAR